MIPQENDQPPPNAESSSTRQFPDRPPGKFTKTLTKTIKNPAFLTCKPKKFGQKHGALGCLERLVECTLERPSRCSFWKLRLEAVRTCENLSCAQILPSLAKTSGCVSKRPLVFTLPLPRRGLHKSWESPPHDVQTCQTLAPSASDGMSPLLKKKKNIPASSRIPLLVTT